MKQIDFNILKRAQHNARQTDKLLKFLDSNGVDLKSLKSNPEQYDAIIKEFSKSCVNTGLFEESRDRLEREFNKLCEYHRTNEAHLADQFYDMAKSIIMNIPEDKDM